jgi:hypothetical protein
MGEFILKLLLDLFLSAIIGAILTAFTPLTFWAAFIICFLALGLGIIFLPIGGGSDGGDGSIDVSDLLN